MSIADGDDEYLMGIEDSQPGQAPLETRVQFTEQTKGKHKYGGIPTIPQGIAAQYATLDASHEGSLEESKSQCPALPPGTIRKCYPKNMKG